jgi:hypothetical protein
MQKFQWADYINSEEDTEDNVSYFVLDFFDL